jgi:hypothetical protein
MCRRSVLILFALSLPALARDRIAYIEFFGYKGIDIEAVRKALPFHEGDAADGPTQETIKHLAHDTVQRVTGRDATDVTVTCCANDGDVAVFIGLPGASSRAFTLNPAPKQDLALSAEMNALNRAMEDAEFASVQKGMAQEDGAPGYRLLKDPSARAAEFRVRHYALQHEDELVRVLESSARTDQRRIAADALGYGERSARQIAALVRAARDPDGDVRNNAVRALGEILRAGASASPRIQADTFIDMVCSGLWTDRNKSVWLLWPLTNARDPQLLERLKLRAGDALMEMARWRASGWAFPARIVLARIAGIPEDRAQALADGPAQAFLEALHR